MNERQMMAMECPSWIKLEAQGGQFRLFCTRCGEEYQIRNPANLRHFDPVAAAFEEIHSKCSPQAVHRLDPVLLTLAIA